MKRRELDFSSLWWAMKYEAAYQVLKLDCPSRSATEYRQRMALYPAVGRRLCLAAWRVLKAQKNFLTSG